MARTTGLKTMAAVTFGVMCLLGAHSTARAQSVQPRSAAPVELARQNSEDVRGAFRDLLQDYPPALGQVLKLDPTLMTNEGYLKPYPALATFLSQHPDVARYPSFYLNFVSMPSSTPREADRYTGVRIGQDMFMGLLVFGGFVVAALTIAGLVRGFITHRRWLRATKLQSEMQGKLLERLTSNEQLLEYVQSPTGQQMLAGTVPLPELPAPAIAAPVTRILWSVQAGLVLAAAGIAMLIVRHYLSVEAGEMLLFFGALGVALGIGFVLAAVSSYVISARLGLLTSARTSGSDRT